MRAERWGSAAAALAFAWAACAAAWAASSVEQGPSRPPGPIPADTLRGWPADSSRAAAPDTMRFVLPESLRAAPPGAPRRGGIPAPARAAAPRGRAPALGAIDLEEARMRGDGSLEAVMRARRGVVVSALPLFGSPTGPLLLPDAGSGLCVPDAGDAAEAATDRPLVAARSAGSRGMDLATSLDDPAGRGVEPLDWDALQPFLAPGTFTGPGEAVARFMPRGAAGRGRGAGSRAARRPRSTLWYRKGDGDALETGARFESPSLGRGVRATYARRVADGLPPLLRSVASRYAIAATLPTLGRHALAADAFLFQRTIEDDRGGRAEWDTRGAALSARGNAGRVATLWTARGRSVRRTQISALGGRERWELPELAASGEAVWGMGDRDTGTVSLRAASRRVRYRVDAAPLFEPLRGSLRAAVGVRRALGAGAGAGLDVAFDRRETMEDAVDVRLALWADRPRLAGRIDLESAHERPSWIDLLTPARADTLENPLFDPAMLVARRSGNPALGTRRLSGILGAGTWAPAGGISVGASASLRRVTGDFGWNARRAESNDTLYLDVSAAERGEGWVSHAAASWHLRAGPVGAEGTAWARGGPGTLGPLGGSPPRRALNASVYARISLFRGNLPLRLETRAHARGPRHGLLVEPAQVTWDAALQADLDQAGIFFEYDNVFDRQVSSGVYEIETGRGASAPGRTVHFGVVWNLLD